MSRLRMVDFDGLRAQALNATLVNERRGGPADGVGERDQSVGVSLSRAMQTIASLWNRRLRPLPEHIAKSRDRMIDAAKL